MMLTGMLIRALEKFERQWSFDAAYLKEIAAAKPAALIRFQFSHQPKPPAKTLPPAAYHTAKLVSVLREDCGTCAQLMVDMALADGVSPDTISAVIEGRFDAVDEELATVYQYVSTISDGQNAEELAYRLRAIYSDEALVALLFAASEARTYPFLKRGLGHAKTCERLRVGDRMSTKGGSSPAPVSPDIDGTVLSQ